MSKLYSIYLDEKKENADNILLFKSGIFYIALDSDAIFLSNTFNLKLTNLNDSIQKCGFPCNSIDKYMNLFKNSNLNIKIIDLQQNTSFKLNEYKQDIHSSEIFDLIKKVDVDSLSVSEAYQFIETLKEKVDSIL